jgi:dTDP-glucose 4,6-dehydratase
MKVLVTGGAGFIGGALVSHLLGEGCAVVNADALTYAAAPEQLAAWEGSSAYAFVQTDICNAPAMAELFHHHQPDAVAHLAAESHVDRSILGPATFIRTNIAGTASLLEVAQAYWSELPADRRGRFRFLHVSTDEVFGTLGPDDPPFTEATPYAPRSPYAASKAAADHLVRAWGETYGLPVLVSNGCNTYGPWQYPEKLIPLMLARALAGRAMPVYGDGRQVRTWLHVDDHAAALAAILTRGEVGETYLVGSRVERRNIELVHQLCDLLDARRPAHAAHTRLIAHVCG